PREVSPTSSPGVHRGLRMPAGHAGAQGLEASRSIARHLCRLPYPEEGPLIPVRCGPADVWSDDTDRHRTPETPLPGARARIEPAPLDPIIAARPGARRT